MRVVDLKLKDGVYVPIGPEREMAVRKPKAQPKARQAPQRRQRNPLDEFFEGIELGKQVLNDLFRRF